MPTDSFSWLHLTDFHYGLKGQDCLWPTLREPFLDSLAALHERCGRWDAVLFTGDLVQSGETAQFEKMQAEVLDPLWEKLRVPVAPCPGPVEAGVLEVEVGEASERIK
jgi:hypothetical protein